MPDTVVAYLHGNDWSDSFGKSVMQMVTRNHGGHIGDVIDSRCASGGLPEGRNAAMRHFLDSELDWLLFVDTDMGFKPEALAALHAVADPESRPIIGGLCFAQREMSHDGRNGYRWQPRPTIFDFIEDDDGVNRFHYRMHYPANSLVQCDATGGAFVLIHRSVGEKIRDQFGEVWFDRIADTDGIISEDLSFFRRWLDVSGSGGCHIHTGVKTTHAKTTWIDERDFWERLPILPATEPVDVIVPVLHRPQNVKPFMDTLTASTGLATAFFVCNPDDDEEIAAVRAAGGRVVKKAGTFAEKVNYCYPKTKAPWVFLVGDDVMFHPAWLDHAQFIGNAYGQAGVVGTNDLGNPRVMGGDHATHLLIRRSYIDEHGASWDGPGVVCHEGYRHWFVDDEMVTAAKQRHAWQPALGSHVEHMHPIWGKGSPDEVYELGQSFAEQDRDTFAARLEKYGSPS